MEERRTGLDLAIPVEAMEAQLEASFGQLVPEEHRRWNVARAASTVIAGTITVALFWMGGYSLPRLAAIAACIVGLGSLNSRVGFDLTTRPPAERRSRVSWPAVGIVFLLLVLMGLSGGMHSPLLPAVPLSFVTYNVAVGWSPTTRATALLTGIGFAALATVPRWLVGPQATEPAFTLLLVAVIAASSFINFSMVREQMLVTEANEAALRRLRDQVLGQMCSRARDMEQVGASLSHELKNPLQAIKILVQLSAREAKEPEARERLRVAEAEVARMQSLIQDYLSFSRPFDKLKTQPVGLGALVDEVIAVLAVRASGAGVSLSRSGDAQIEADPRRLREALHNLVSNAIEASPGSACVDVVVSEAGGSATVAVHDSGKGMTKETLARLGTPFFTTRADGNGLGVALARAAVAQHGGALDYQSEPGKGTTAIATLPKKPIERSTDGPRAGC